jgi:hypothetical protein
MPPNILLIDRAPALRPELKINMEFERRRSQSPLEEEEEEERPAEKEEDKIFNDLMARYGYAGTHPSREMTLQRDDDSRSHFRPSVTATTTRLRPTITGTTTATTTDSCSDDEKGGGIFRLTSPTKREV